MHPKFAFPNILFKHPLALIYHLFHIYFSLKCSSLPSHPSATLHVSAVHGHHQVSSIFLKLLQCQNFLSRVKEMFLD
jgi:hypothetical protein